MSKRENMRPKNFLSQDYVTSLMAELASRPSELGPLKEADPSVLAFIAEEVAARLAAFGIDDQTIDIKGNLIARIGKRRPDAGRLLLVMNAMTQPAFDMPEAFSPKTVDGAPFGIPGPVMLARGLSEQKANMAAMLAGIAAAASEPDALEGELIIVCCPSGETGQHDAIAHAVEAEGVTADMAVLGGSSLEIAIGNRGRIDLQLEVEGRPSHSSRPEQGANAALAGCRIVCRLIDRGNDHKAHPDLGKASLTLTGIRSQPETTHTVQARCVATLDRRLLPGEDPHDVAEHLRDLIAQDGPYRDPFSGEELKVTLTMGAYMYPSWVEPDSQVVQALQSASRSAGLNERKVVYLPNAFDQGYLNHRGIPAVNFGCGEYAFAHTVDDLASIERTRDAAEVFYYLIRSATSARKR